VRQVLSTGFGRKRNIAEPSIIWERIQKIKNPAKDSMIF
jgi:hypothetical protein